MTLMLILLIHERVKIPNLFTRYTAGHVVTGNMKIIPDSRILNIVSKGRRNIKTKHPGVREMAYNTLVRPQLEYAAVV